MNTTLQTIKRVSFVLSLIVAPFWGGSFVFAYDNPFANTTVNVNTTDHTATVTNLPINSGERFNSTSLPTGTCTTVDVTLVGDGSEGHPFEIGTVDQWNAFAYIVNNTSGMNTSCAKLTADITFSNNHSQPGLQSTDNNVKGRKGTKYYSGTFDGQGHTITLNFNEYKENGVLAGGPLPENNSGQLSLPSVIGTWGGLFFYVGGATIKNLHVAGTIRSQLIRCGTIAHNISSGTCSLINCLSTVEVISVNGEDKYGGLVGQQSGGTINISNCFANGKLSIDVSNYENNNHLNGGCVGSFDSGSLNISNSYVQPQDIQKTGNNDYHSYLLPFSYSSYSNNPTVTNSYYKYPSGFDYLITTQTNQGTDKAASGTAEEIAANLNTNAKDENNASCTPWVAHNDTVYLATFAKYVHIVNWTYGSPETPTIVGNKGNGAVTYQVKKGDGDYVDYTAGTELDAGDYTLKASVAANNGWNAWESTMNFSISQKEVTVSGITASNKTYDGNTTATLDYTGVVISGKEGGDDLTASASSGTFDNANVGEGKTVTISGLILSGSKAGNYTLAASGQQTTTTANITKANLTVTAKPKSITYGDAPANDGVSYSGFVNNETENTDGVFGGTLSYAYNYAQYGDVGSYTITPSGLTSSNYKITFTAGTLTVAQKDVGLSWSTPTTFTYDGQSHCLTATATGLVNQDAITVTVDGAQTNAGSHTATASALTGEKAGNYKLPDANTQGFTINKMQVKVSGITASDKTYDKNTTATLVYDNITFTPSIVSGDNLSVTASGTFPNEYVEVGKTVTISGLTLSGTSAGNYQLKTGEGVQQSSTTASITPKTVGLNWSATSFDYDGIAKAPTATATDLEAGDECNVTVNVPGEHTAVGFYTATATTLSNTNYALPALATQEYKIVRPMTGIEFTASKHWNTYCAFENLATPEGITAYIVTGTNGDKATTSQIDYIPQGVGVLLYGEAGSDIRASAYTGATGSFTNNKLVGVTAATTIAAEAGYVLYGDAFVLTTGGTLSANRSYLPANGAALTRSLIIEGGDGATSIESIEDHQATDGRWFDMQGRRIDKPKKKGLYILDGKKIVIK